MLAPGFPHSQADCTGAQTQYLPALVIAGVVGVALLVVAVLIAPGHRARPRRDR